MHSLPRLIEQHDLERFVEAGLLDSFGENTCPISFDAHDNETSVWARDRDKYRHWQGVLSTRRINVTTKLFKIDLHRKVPLHPDVNVRCKA